MKTLRRLTLGLFALTTLALAGSPAPAAAGAAPGPYYAWPSWDQTLPAATRFIVLTNMNSAAVLDRETGLVWEQSPDTNRRNWASAQLHCNQRTVGNRKGWRLPTVQELASLIDPSQSNPALPAGHPFTNVQSNNYWSATTVADVPIAAWNVLLIDGGIFAGPAKTVAHFAWCVRGGQGVDPQ